MKITYKPLPENGEKIIKYGIAFERDQTVDVSDEKLAKRLLTNSYFVVGKDEEITEVTNEIINEVTNEVTKRKRRTKAEMEALRNGENQSTSSTPSPSDDAGS